VVIVPVNGSQQLSVKFAVFAGQRHPRKDEQARKNTHSIDCETFRIPATIFANEDKQLEKRARLQKGGLIDV